MRDRCNSFIYLIPVLLLTILISGACSSSEEEPEEVTEEQEIVVEQHDVTPEFKTELTNIMLAYEILYEAILDQDKIKIDNAVDEFRSKIYSVEPEGLHQSAIREWQNLVEILSEEAQSIKNETQKIAIEAHFYAITDIFSTALERYDTTEITIYRFFCEDAFSGSGAAWLSTTNEIRNPYLVDAAPNCGELESVFEASN